ncbi:MAG: CBS domain-containing protein [Chloroflexota bacterium]
MNAFSERDAEMHALNLTDYLDELRHLADDADLEVWVAGEQALKTLDRFLASLATALGMENARPGMHDSIQFLIRQQGQAESIAQRAERFRPTRNALAHNPDLMLKPEAAMRILDAVERIIRGAAQTAFDLARRPPVTVEASEPAEMARDRMLDRGYRQLVVVDERGKLLDLLTDREIVLMGSRSRREGRDQPYAVRDLIEMRDHRVVAPVGRHWSVQEVAEALEDERVAAAVVTEHGKVGEAPLGVITRGDILKMR